MDCGKKGKIFASRNHPDSAVFYVLLRHCARLIFASLPVIVLILLFTAFSYGYVLDITFDGLPLIVPNPLVSQRSLCVPVIVGGVSMAGL